MENITERHYFRDGRHLFPPKDNPEEAIKYFLEAAACFRDYAEFVSNPELTLEEYWASQKQEPSPNLYFIPAYFGTSEVGKREMPDAIIQKAVLVNQNQIIFYDFVFAEICPELSRRFVSLENFHNWTVNNPGKPYVTDGGKIWSRQEVFEKYREMQFKLRTKQSPIMLAAAELMDDIAAFNRI